MANRVVIEVVARYKDEARASLDATSKSAEKAKKKLEETAGAAAKLGKMKPKILLDADDRASNKIAKAMSKASAFATRTYKAALDFTDKASNTLNRVSGAARSFANKTFSAAVKIIDYATTPLQKIKNALFSIKTLVAGVMAGVVAKQAILDPISIADAYSSTKIGFSTLLGDERGQQMMDEMDAFAKKTPFKTSNVISNAQKMMAYGWDPEKILTDMETIGNAAAATGKMDQGLESIVYALSEIRSKGKLSTQELNQLAGAGIKAKAYLAEGLGYGTSDEGMMKLAADLEKGVIGANQAIELILQGMKEFDGMMDRTANETVAGLKAQLEDVFEINIARRWGQGLQEGAKRGLGSIVSLLDKSEDSLSRFGDMLYEAGRKASNWVADKLETAINTIMSLMDSGEFKNASLGGKINILWEKVIAEPFSAWWASSGKELFAKKASEIGYTLGSGLSNGLLALLGVDVAGAAVDGASIGASFAKGFADGFDGSAVTGAIAKAIADVWDVLPWWAKALVGAKGLGVAGSALSGANTILKGAGKIPYLIGSAGTAMVGGSGLLGGLANAGYALTGGPVTAGAYFGASTAMSGGAAAAVGGGTILGGILGLLGIGSGVKSLVQGNYWGGGTKLGLVGAGAAAGAGIGSAVPVLGTGIGALIGAGVGGLGAMLGGDKLGEALSKLTSKVSTFFSETLPNNWDSFWDSVGSFFTEKVPYAIGYAAGATVKFFTETLPEKWNSFWTSIDTFFTDTLPTWAGSVWEDEICPFFKEDIPEFLSTLWDNVSTFVTEGIPSIASTIWGNVSSFFTDTVPNWFESVWDNLKGGFAAGAGDSKNGSAKRNAAGGIVGARTLSWLGEEGPEAVIPLGAKHRHRALGLLQQAGDALGMGGGGGIQLNMGGVTIQVNGSGNVVGDIEAQKEEIAEQVAAIFYRVLDAQYKNMPAKGGA